MAALLFSSSLSAYAKKPSREELEISSWSITDVTDQYQGINDRYQDSISSCGDTSLGNGEPQPTPQLPGAPDFSVPGLGNQNPSVPGVPTDPNDPFETPPSQGNVNPGNPGYPIGPQPWDSITNPGMGGGPLDPTIPTPQDPVSRVIGAGIIVDVITNIGRRIWDLVNMGKPVSFVKSNIAHGLPKGIKCWTDLEGWSWPQSKVFNVTYKNKLGATSIDYTYRISYIYGGNIEGIGKYLSNVQVVPVNLKVGWGYSLYSRAEVPTVFNVGSKKDPVAGMQINVRWKVQSAFTNSELSHMFHVGGNNEFKKSE